MATLEHHGYYQWLRSARGAKKRHVSLGNSKLFGIKNLVDYLRDLTSGRPARRRNPLEPPCTDSYARWCGRGEAKCAVNSVAQLWAEEVQGYRKPETGRISGRLHQKTAGRMLASAASSLSAVIWAGFIIGKSERSGAQRRPG